MFKRAKRALAVLRDRRDPVTGWTDEQFKEINAEMADGVIREIREVLELVGCCHGHEMASTPPMFYPETIMCAIQHVRGKHIKQCQSACEEPGPAATKAEPGESRRGDD